MAELDKPWTFRAYAKVLENGRYDPRNFELNQGAFSDTLFISRIHGGDDALDKLKDFDEEPLIYKEYPDIGGGDEPHEKWETKN